MKTVEEIGAELEAQWIERQRIVNTNLPSWAEVKTACDNISSLDEAKAFLKKISRAVYYLAKNSEV